MILSYGLWQQLFGGSPSAVGMDLRIYGNPYTVVGVMPKDFLFLNPEVRLWRPLAFTPEQKMEHHSNSWEMIGRLKPGATIAQAQAQVNAINAENLERFPEFKDILINAGNHTRVLPLQREVVREIRRTLYLLWGAVLFVLLIGTVNIANLMLARATARMRELATRFALGAGRWRVTRQLLTESTLLTFCSAALGLPLGYWALRAVSALGLDRIPRGSEIALDGRVVVFVLGLSLAAGAVLGLIPVVHAWKIDSSSVFRGDGRSGTSIRSARIWRNALAMAQIALAFILLAGAGLLLASFRQVLAIKPGFITTSVLSGWVALPSSRYAGDAEIRAFMDRALERLRRLPGVQSAGATDSLPLGGDYSDNVILAEGYVMQPGESMISPSRISVTPGYFEAMGVTSALRKAIAELDPELPLYDVHTMQERIDDSLVSRKSPMLLSVGFGAIALLLAAVGIYGVLAYMVAQRTREIGIRIAIGSSSEEIFRLVLGEGARIVSLGFVLGLVGALALGRFVRSLLFGVQPMDPAVLGVVAGLLTLVGLVACFLPARKATRVDPVYALRQADLPPAF